MPIHAGHATGSTGSPSTAALAAIARMQQGAPQQGGVPTPGGSTDGGLDVSSLLAGLKSGQVSPQQLIQMLSMLMGQGMMNPQAGNMQAIQDSGQGGPPQGAQSPIMTSMMGGAGPQGVAGS